MAPKRYIIWTIDSINLNMIINTISYMCDTLEIISHQVLCIEIQLDEDDVVLILEDIPITILEIKENTMKKLEGTFIGEDYINVQKFLNKTRTPETIDEVLDIISVKGSVCALNSREYYALHRLTKEL